MRRPTGDELAGLVNEFVREKVLYRKALALGLGRARSAFFVEGQPAVSPARAPLKSSGCRPKQINRRISARPGNQNDDTHHTQVHEHRRGAAAGGGGHDLASTARATSAQRKSSKAIEPQLKVRSVFLFTNATGFEVRS